VTEFNLLIIFWGIGALCLGASLGSFASAWAVRYLKNQSIVFPGSKCDWCGTPLKWWMNIPVISFLVLRGRTHCCHVTIPRMYWLNEMLMGIFTLKVMLTFIVTPDVNALLILLKSLLLGFLLLLVSTTDLICRIIPNRFLMAGVLGNFFLLGGHSLLRGQLDSEFLSAVSGLVIGYVSLWSISFVYELLRKREGIGGGDIKLFAFLGCFLGPVALPYIIFYASFLAVLFFGLILTVQKKFSLSSEVPFGPFLSLGAILYFFGGAQIMWLLRLSL